MSRKFVQRSTSLLLMFMLTFSLVSTVFADAGNPILGTINSSVQFHPNGSVTVTVRGEWNWLSHNSDCNFDRAATGVGIIWNDPTETGYTVSKNAISAEIGVKTKDGSWADPNPLDAMVHPVDRGNVPQGYTDGTWQSTGAGYPVNAAGEYPLGQQFVDPALPASGIPGATQLAAWRGGCGREPLSGAAAGQYAGDPWGSWGYEKNYSHTFRQVSDITSVCVNFYDVHGGGDFDKPNEFQIANNTDEIIVDENGDNSIETNAFNVNNGANCIDVDIPEPDLVTQASGPVSVGEPISDVATLSGGSVPTGTITFNLYGPNNATCTGAPIFTSTKTVNAGNGDYTSDPFTPLLPGAYRWIANYSGDLNNAPTGNTCNEANETSTVLPGDIKISKTADHATPVNAGDQIGFTVKVWNAGTGSAAGVKLTDVLPTDPGLNWSIENQGAGWAGSCTILTGTLTCGGAAGKTVPGSTTEAATTFTVHIVSPTTGATAGVCPGTGDVTNIANVSTTNDGAGQATATECVQAGDIKIAKTADHAAPVNAGDQIGFTIKVWNTGAGTAVGTKLTDTLPTDPGTSWTIESQGAGWGGTCLITAGVLNCGGAAGVTVPGNTTQGATTFTVHIVSGTTAATAGTCPGTGEVPNTASVSTTNDGSGTASATECVNAGDIKISKTADHAAPVNAGEQVGFTIKVWNTGAGNAAGVKLTDTLPTDPGTSWSIQNQGAGWGGSCLIAGGILTCGGAAGVTVPGNTPEATTTYTVHIVSGTTAATAGPCPGFGSVDNSASVSTTNDGSGQANASECVLAADIEISKSPDNQTSVSAGDTIGFTVKVWNAGPGNATGVKLNDPLPTDPGLNWVIANQGNGWNGTCGIAAGVLSCGGAAGVTVPGNTAEGTTTFTVHITSTTTAATAGLCPGTGTVSNTGFVTTTNDGSGEATATECVQAGDIKISKSPDNQTSVSAGDTIGFTVKVWNAGAGNATGVKLNDPLPTDPGLNWVIAGQGAGWAGTCAIAAGNLTCGGAAGVTVPGNTLEGTTTFTVHITSTTTAATAGLCPGTGTVSNTGFVTTTNDGSGNATATECVQAGDIKISKTADHATSVSAGDQIGFTIKVWNAGAGNATGVKLADVLPTDAGLNWSIQAQGTGWAGTCAIAAGSLTCGGAAGVTVPGNTAEGTTTFTVHIISPTTAATAGLCPGTGEVNNTANVSTTNDGSGQASATECVQAGDIKISKSPDHQSSVSAGDQIGFTIKVWNAGAGNATGVKLSDILPTDAGLNWTIQAQGAGWAGTCAIVTGTLTCGGAAGVTVPGNTAEGTTTFTVHIISPTTAATAGLCPGTGEVDNTANVSTTNDGTGQASAEECVQAGDIKISKSPDHLSSVSAGDQIGFTIKVWNAGAGNATGVKLADVLPTDAGLNWSIQSQGAGWAGTCAIAAGSLTCGGAAGVTVPGNTTEAATTFTVHIISPTTAATAGLCPGNGSVDNTANVSTTNDGSGQASASECVQAGDIKILKTADHAAPVSAGDQIGFTLTVWNAGPGNLTGVKLLDTLPTDPGLNWSVQSQGAGWAGTCAIAAGALTCGGAAGVTVPGNTTQGASTYTVHIISSTTGATAGPCPGTGEVNNTGSVSTTNDGTSQSSATECVLAGDIKITKTPDHAAPVSAGDTIGFTLTVWNAGPGNATGVKLTDTLPTDPGLNWVLAGQGAGWAGTCAINTGVLTCGGAAGVTVAGNTTLAGSNFTVHITSTTTAATAGSCPAGTGTVTNTGSVSTTNDGSDDDTASECVQAGDIQIAKTADHAAPVSAGDQIGFTLTVYNAGAGNATGVKLTDILPTNPGLSWTVAGQGAGWGATTCAIAAGTLTCGGAAGVTVPGNLTQGASTFTVHITSTTTALTGGVCPGTGTVSNTGSVSTTNDGSDSASASECVQAPDIRIEKTPDHLAPVSAGDTIGFTLTVYNAGAGTAAGVKLTDTLPTNPGLNWIVAGQGAGWGASCAINTGVLTCGGAAGVSVPGNLTQGASTFTVHVTSITTAATGGLCPGSGTVNNIGSVSTTNDGSAADEASECVQAPDIEIEKTPDHAGSVSAGDTIGFTLTVYNVGAGNAAGVKLTDTLPVNAGLNWIVAGQGAGWAGTCAINTGVLTCGGAAGVTVPGNTTQAAITFTVHITSTTTAATGGLCPGTGTVSNTGSVSTTNDGTDEDTASECVQAGDIKIVKTPDHLLPVSPGDQIGFTLTVYNAGAGAVAGVKLADVLPTDAGLNWSIQAQGAGWAGTCAIAAGSLTCGGAAGVTVPGNTTAVASTFTVHIVSPTTAATGGNCPGTGEVDNTGTVSSTNDGSGTSSAEECVESVDIRVAKVADAEGVVAGQPIGFRIIVWNAGNGIASGVKLSDILPPDLGLNWQIAPSGVGLGWTGAGANCSISAGTPKTLECGGASGVNVPGALSQQNSLFTVHIVSTTTAQTAAQSPVQNEACVASSNGGQGCANDDVDVFLLTLEKDNNAPDIELPDGTVLPTQGEGKFVTYTLTYDVGVTPVHNAILTDVLPAGVTFQAAPAPTSTNPQLTFVGYTPATRTLTWHADTLSADGSVSYVVKVDVGAAKLTQPLINHAAIESEETPEDTAQSQLFVPPPPKIETKTPTGPPTNAIATTEGTTNGSSLLLVLAALGLIVIAVSFVTPVPATIRRRNRR